MRERHISWLRPAPTLAGQGIKLATRDALTTPRTGQSPTETGYLTVINTKVSASGPFPVAVSPSPSSQPSGGLGFDVLTSLQTLMVDGALTGPLPAPSAQVLPTSKRGL